MTKPEALPPNAAGVDVPFQRVSTFVRQVTHDVRNSLNAMELQAAYVLELVDDPEAVEEIRRLRTQIQQSARTLQALSAHFWLPQPSLIEYSAAIFAEDFRDRLAKKYPERAPCVQWTVEVGNESISTDIELIFAALAEVFSNAFHFSEKDGTITARAFSKNGQFVIELQESRSSAPESPEKWGAEPFVSTRRGAYGLGLFRTRMILAAHGGDLQYSYDPGSGLLTARISLPLAG